jgi:hypothetical protein
LVYTAQVGAQLEEDEETQAQKIIFGLLFLLYPSAFFFLWALFWYTLTGAVLAAVTVYLFVIHNNRLINDNYKRHLKLPITAGPNAWLLLGMSSLPSGV